MVGAVVEAWNASSSGRLKTELLEPAVRLIVAGASSGSVVRSSVVVVAEPCACFADAGAQRP
jgi:hypothetical protein